jgi:hypothetical protein
MTIIIHRGIRMEEEKIDFHVRINKRVAEKIEEASKILGQDRSKFIEQTLEGCMIQKDKGVVSVICPAKKYTIEKKRIIPL